MTPLWELLLVFFSHSWETTAVPGLQPRPSAAPFGLQAQIQPYTLLLQRPTQQLWLMWWTAPPHRHQLLPRWVGTTTCGACGAPPWAGAAQSPGLAPPTAAIKRHTKALNRSTSWIWCVLYAKWNCCLFLNWRIPTESNVTWSIW